MGTTHRLAIIAVTAGLLVATLAVTTAIPTVRAATCRVRNVTQDTTGTSLTRMVERAADGDVLRVRGTCSGPVIVAADVTIEGAGVTPTISGHDQTRGVYIRQGATVTLRGLRIVHGHAVGYGGGGILNHYGDLSLEDSAVAWNTANDCGGIRSTGRLRLLRSSAEHNTAEGSGGGVCMDGPGVIRGSLIRRNAAKRGGGVFVQPVGGTHEVTVARTIIGHNIARSDGGGILTWPVPEVGGWGTLTLSRVRVRDNRAQVAGGGIWNRLPLIVLDSVIRDNRAGRAGGGIRNARPGRVSLDAGTSVFGNVPDDCVGTPAC